MTLDEICAKVGGTVAVPVEGAAAESVYVGDLLSDVMGHAGDECALVTIQNHLNTIAVCTLVGCSVMAEGAAREGVAIVTTPMSQYEAALALSSLPPSKH